ncbi:MAG: MFS transporter [Alphaproteobacteria bacterium]|nr:MFS transporter [Alphaproteobacteria bacterium]
MNATKTRIRWQVMFTVFLIATVSYLDRTNLSVAAPVIRQELHLSPTQLGLVLSAFSWSYAIAQIPAGLIASWLRPRRTYFVALWLWCILLALTTTATSFGAWIFFRIPFGLAEAITWPAASVLMSRWFPRIEYSQAMSLQNLGLVVGAAVAPPIVAFIIAFWGWKAAFIVTGLIAGMLGTFFYIYTKDDPADDPRVSPEELAWIRHDQVPQDNSPLPKGYIRMLLGRPSLWAVGMANFGLDFVNFLFLAWYPTYLTDKYHMSLGRMGVMAMEPYIFALITVLGAGRLVRLLTDRGMDSVSARRMIIFGGLFIGTAALVVTVNVSNLYASVTAMSLGYAFVMSILGPMWSTPAEIAGAKGVGFASGFVNFVGNVGGIGSPILMGVVFQHFHSFTPAILIAAGITMICGVLFLLLYRAKADKEFVDAFLASKT